MTIHDLLEQAFGGREWPGGVLRLAMLRTQYRQPIDWTRDGLEESDRILDSWRASLLAGSTYQMEFNEGHRDQYEQFEPHQEVINALKDDLNTPSVIAILHKLSKSAEVATKQQFFGSLKFLGFTNFDVMKREQALEGELDNDSRVSVLVQERDAARARRDWKESDRIRDELAKMGVVLKDTKDGTTWEIARST